MRDRCTFRRRDRHHVTRSQLVLILARLCVQCRSVARLTVVHSVDVVRVGIPVVRPTLR